jgi:hypothetical protein
MTKPETAAPARRLRLGDARARVSTWRGNESEERAPSEIAVRFVPLLGIRFAAVVAAVLVLVVTSPARGASYDDLAQTSLGASATYNGNTGWYDGKAESATNGYVESSYQQSQATWQNIRPPRRK